VTIPTIVRQVIILIVLVLITFSFQGCSSSPKSRLIERKNRAIDEFFAAMSNQTKERTIIKRLDNNAGGVYDRINRTVTINSARLDLPSTDPELIDYVVWHELGHYRLFLVHNEDLMKDGCPRTLMYPRVMMDCWKKHKEMYKKEVFRFQPDCWR